MIIRAEVRSSSHQFAAAATSTLECKDGSAGGNGPAAGGAFVRISPGSGGYPDLQNCLFEGMKKRLRKKKHVGEFAELGCQIVVKRNRKDGFSEFLDAFIDEAIEANGCYCGGGGHDDSLDVVVELGRPSEAPEQKLRQLTAWLDARDDVQDYHIGPLTDLWYGEVEQLEGCSNNTLHWTAEDGAV